MTMPLSFYNHVTNINNNLPAETPLPMNLIPPTYAEYTKKLPHVNPKYSMSQRLPLTNPFVCSFNSTQQRNLSDLICRPHLHSMKTKAIIKQSNDKSYDFNSVNYRQFFDRVTQPIKDKFPMKSKHNNNKSFHIPRRDSDFDLYQSPTKSFHGKACLEYEIEQKKMKIRHQQQLEHLQKCRKINSNNNRVKEIYSTKPLKTPNLPVSQAMVNFNKDRSYKRKGLPVSHNSVQPNSNNSIHNNKSWHRIPQSYESVSRKQFESELRYSKKRALENSVEQNFSRKKSTSNSSQLNKSPFSAQPIDDPIILDLIKKGAIIYNSFA
jgi:hypothetical protein